MKETAITQKSPQTKRTHQSPPLCVWLVTMFTPFLLGTARTKCVQVEVKWDQPLLVKSDKSVYKSRSDPSRELLEGLGAPQPLWSVSEFKERFTSCKHIPHYTHAKGVLCFRINEAVKRPQYLRECGQIAGWTWNMARCYQFSRRPLISEPSGPLATEPISSLKHQEFQPFIRNESWVQGSIGLFLGIGSALPLR